MNTKPEPTMVNYVVNPPHPGLKVGGSIRVEKNSVLDALRQAGYEFGVAYESDLNYSSYAWKKIGQNTFTLHQGGVEGDEPYNLPTEAEWPVYVGIYTGEHQEKLAHCALADDVEMRRAGIRADYSFEDCTVKFDNARAAMTFLYTQEHMAAN
mgnify:CR=1 FL=1|tara:strand:- start:6574 stop:7032 length:459 start_codon:yes stop_codon:yes gene_type:complete